MAVPVYLRIDNATSMGESVQLYFKGVPKGQVKVRWPSGREEIRPIDDLPPRWQEQIRKWNNFGRGLRP
jgi:hypothetical protein